MSEAKDLATDGRYFLTVEDGRYRAGCRDFTRIEALKHWRAAQLDENWCDKECPDCIEGAARGKLFVAAILAFKPKAKRKAPKKAARKSK